MERLVGRLGVTFLITGVRKSAEGGGLGRNHLHLGVRAKGGWADFHQDKHHRWCLDRAQIRQYHLSRVLDPAKLWWEAIDLPVRTVQIVDVGGGATIAPLVCEDLARLDEVADILRRVGPGLVVTLLLDGPQCVGTGGRTRFGGAHVDLLRDGRSLATSGPTKVAVGGHVERAGQGCARTRPRPRVGRHPSHRRVGA